MTIDAAFLKKNFEVVWQPDREKVKPFLLKRKRVVISINRLHEYIGEKKADFIIKNVVKMKEDKKRFRVQNKGIVDVYVK